MAGLFRMWIERTFARKHIDYVDSTTMISGRIKSQLFQGPDSIVQQDRTEVGIQVIEFGIGDEANGKPAISLNYGISSKLLILLRDNKPVAFDEVPDGALERPLPRERERRFDPASIPAGILPHDTAAWWRSTKRRHCAGVTASS